MRLRPDNDIRSDIETDVLHRALVGNAGDITVGVADGVVTLTGRVDRASIAGIAARLIRQVPGVVAVVDKVAFDYDDRDPLGAGIAFGAA